MYWYDIGIGGRHEHVRACLRQAVGSLKDNGRLDRTGRVVVS